MTRPITKHVLAAGEGETSSFGGCTNRFLVDGADTDGRVALVEFTVRPGTLAGPLHRHSVSDVWTWVLSGSIAATVGGEEVVVRAGELLRKPKGEWSTFWNPGEEPAVMLELLSPAGLEELFKQFTGTPPEPQELVRMAAKYDCDIDLEGTMALAQRHGVAFG